MASIRFRSNKWQARVSRKGEQSLVKTFRSKEDAERWARSVEVEWDRGTYTNIHQAQKTTTFKELLYLEDLGHHMEIFHENGTRTRGRKLNIYLNLNLNDPRQL